MGKRPAAPGGEIPEFVGARAEDRDAAMKAGADAVDELLRRLFG